MMPESDKQVETSPVFTFFHIFVAVEILNLLIFQGDKGDDDDDDDGDVDWDVDVHLAAQCKGVRLSLPLTFIFAPYST